MDAEQLQHVEHFFYAQLARDARLGYFDAERVLFIKKVMAPRVSIHRN